jgi:hypothetical protein
VFLRKSFVAIKRCFRIKFGQCFVAASHLLLTLDACSMDAVEATMKVLREVDVEQICAASDTLHRVGTPSLNVLAEQSNAAALATIHKFIVGSSSVCGSAEVQKLMQSMYERFSFMPVLLGSAGPVLHQLQQQPIMQQTAATLGVVSNTCEALALSLQMTASMLVVEDTRENTALKQQLVRRVEAAGAMPLGCNMIDHFELHSPRRSANNVATKTLGQRL